MIECLSNFSLSNFREYWPGSIGQEVLDPLSRGFAVQGPQGPQGPQEGD